jgi:hypothetical protein
VTSGSYLRGNGTDVVMNTIQVADVPTLNQNTTGTAANVTGIVAVVNGGTGTTTPSIVAGTNVTVTGTWPNQTIASSGGGSATLTIVNKTAAYTVVAGDLGKVINCTSNLFTISLTAAATLGAGFNVTIWNTSTSDGDAVTIDPAGSETIDGLTTLIIRPGEGMQIVCNGTNWDTGDKKVMRAYAENNFTTRPVASGSFSLALGGLSGVASEATSTYSLAIFGSATSQRSSAIGLNSAAERAVTATGAGAMALGGSYASGTDSFAAGIGSNSATYGARSTGAVALGNSSSVSAIGAVAIGNSTVASGIYSLALGFQTTVTAQGAFAFGATTNLWQTNATATNSFAFGTAAQALLNGKLVISGGDLIATSTHEKGLQTGIQVLRGQTTDATAKVLVSDTGLTAPGTTNQVILPDNSAFTFTGLIVARRQAAGGTQSAAFKVEGLIRREGTAASTTLVASTVTAISNVPGWVLALSADTTNGGLAVTATGAAATNIRWVATINTSEVIYA